MFTSKALNIVDNVFSLKQLDNHLYCYDNNNSTVLHITIGKNNVLYMKKTYKAINYFFIYSLIISITIWKSVILIMRHYIQDMICSWLKWFQYNQKTFYMINMWNFQVIKMLKCIIYFLLHHAAFTICSFQLLSALQTKVKK